MDHNELYEIQRLFFQVQCCKADVVKIMAFVKSIKLFNL